MFLTLIVFHVDSLDRDLIYHVRILFYSHVDLDPDLFILLALLVYDITGFNNLGTDFCLVGLALVFH